MNTKDAIEHFGSIKELAKALVITQPAIYQWGDKVPELRAYQIADLIAQQNTEQKAA